MEPIDFINIIIKVFQAAVNVKKAIETKKEVEYQTEILKVEAKEAENQAAEERQSGIEEARRTRLKTILNMSETKTDIASGNINLFSSTALNLVSDDKLNGELDALVTLKNSESRAKSYIQQSQKYYQDASLKTFSGKNNFINSLANTTLKLASEGSEIFQKYKKK